MALTQKQLEWSRRVYSQSGALICHFPLYSEERGWYICGSTRAVHIHHIQPQGWVRRILGRDPDFPTNLIATCAFHHVGRGYRGSLDHYNDVVYVVHTDAAWAYRRYRKDSESFEKVFAGRGTRTDKGQGYWNDDFDRDLQEIADRIVGRYLTERRDDPWPERRR